MRPRPLDIILLFSTLLLSCGHPEQVNTKKTPKEFVEFGNKRIDDYFWLSNPQDSAVIRHLEQENTFTEAALKHTEGLQKRIEDELIARIEQKYETLPLKTNGYWYYYRYQEGSQYPVHYRRKGTLDAPEEVLLDIPRLSAGHQIFIVNGLVVSPDQRLLAYGVDTSGGQRMLLHVANLSTRKPAMEEIPNTSGEYAWASDSKTLFYAVNDETVRPYKVMRHLIGTPATSDLEVLTEPDSTFAVHLSTTRDNKFIFVSVGYTQSRETRYILADRPQMTPVMIQPRIKDLAYSVIDYEGSAFFIRTNANAMNFKIVRAPIASPGMRFWTDVIPGRDDALIDKARIFRNYIVAAERIKGLCQIMIQDRRSGRMRTVDFPEEAYVASFAPATDAYDLDSVRLEYSSLTTPRTFYTYNLRTGEKTLLKQDKVGGGYADSLYETRRIWTTSSPPVPITLVDRKSLFKQDATNPLLLYGYGSYGYTVHPYFNRSVVSLLDRGFVFAIADIRGGEDLGRQWYEDGKMMKKKHTFEDFVACAQYLVDQKFTSPRCLFAGGGSAGGMLMGAVVNMRPDLFRGVVAEVPWMDVVTDMFNSALPLTTLEYDEWGNPNIKEQYDYMLSWSPYDNVRDAAYPAIFATGGLNDTQVPYYSPAKWVAKVREHNTGKNLVYLKINMGAGHGGESGRFERQKLIALQYAFLLDLLGEHE